MSAALDDAIKNAVATAEWYRNYASRFTPGSLGYLLNMSKATQYAEMAERWGRVNSAPAGSE